MMPRTMLRDDAEFCPPFALSAPIIYDAAADAAEDKYLCHAMICLMSRRADAAEAPA